VFIDLRPEILIQTMLSLTSEVISTLLTW